MVIAFFQLIISSNARIISIIYLFASLFSLFFSFLLSLLFRAELSGLGAQLLFGDFQFYYTSVTSHGIGSIFFWVVPFLLSFFSNLLIPFLVSSPELVFPRTNALSIHLFLVALLLLVVSVFIDEGTGTG